METGRYVSLLSLGVPIERIVLLGTRTDVVGKWSGNTNPEEKTR